MKLRIGLAFVLLAAAFTLGGCSFPIAISSRQITPDHFPQKLAASDPNYQAFCVKDGRESRNTSFGYEVHLKPATVSAALSGALAGVNALAKPGKCRYTVSATVVAFRAEIINMPFAPLPITSVVSYDVSGPLSTDRVDPITITDHFEQPYIFDIPLMAASAETVHHAIRNSIRDNLKKYVESLIDAPEPSPVS